MSVIIKDNKAAWDKFVHNMTKFGQGRRAQVGIFRKQGKILSNMPLRMSLGRLRYPNGLF